MSEFREYDLLEYPLTEGRVLIEAAAGSGKTYTIQYLFLRLLLEREDLNPGEILVVTFTEAATEELRERIRTILARAHKRLKEEGDEPPAREPDDLDRILARARERAGSRERLLQRLGEIRRLFDEAVIATIHGFCSRILAEYAFEAGVRRQVELVTDSRRFCRMVAEEYWRRRFYGNFLGPLEERLAVAGIDPGKLEELAGELERKPELEILPATPAAGSWPAELRGLLAGMARQVAAWRELAGEALEVLRNARREIREEMFAAGALNARSWKADAFAGRADELALLLADSDLPAAAEVLEKFSRSYLERITRSRSRPPAHRFFELCEELYRRARDFSLRQQQAAALVRRDFADFARGPEGFAAVKRELRCQGYGDFLTELRRVLAEPRGKLVIARLRERFRVAMIDEFQDTDPVQYEIFNRLFVAAGILFYRIGDPKQSIYAFRGADIFAYLAAAREPGQVRATLDHNFRSTPELLAALNRIFTIPRPFFVPGIEYRPARPGQSSGTRLLLDGRPVAPFSFWYLADAAGGPLTKPAATWRLARLVADHSRRLLTAGRLLREESDTATPLKASEIALLTRTNREAVILWRACHARGVPAILAAAGNLWESDEARALFLFLRAAVNPENDWKLSTALATPLIGRPPAWLDRVRAAAAAGRELEDRAGLEFLAWRLAFIRAREGWKSRGIVAMLARFPDFSDAEIDPAPGFNPALSLASGFRGERSLANFFHLQEVLHEAERELQLGPEALLEWFHEQLGAARDEKEYELRLETEAEAIRILTVHRSKGLEFPVVMAPFLWSGSFAGRNRHDRLLVFHREVAPGRFVATLDLNPEPDVEHLAAARGERLAEDLRLAYVALTRAGSAVRMAWAQTAGSGQTALMYLRCPPADDNRRREFVSQAKLKATPAVIDGDQARIWEADENIEREDLDGRWRPPAERERPAATSGRPEADRIGPARTFNRRLPPAAGVVSFSRLTAGAFEAWLAAGFGERELAERDSGNRACGRESADEALAREDDRVRSSGLINLKAGAAAGSALHEIFEKLDYTVFAESGPEAGGPGNSPAPTPAARKLVSRTLAAYGLLPAGAEAELVSEVLELVTSVLNLPLPGSGLEPETLRLSAADLEMVREMEFWLPLADNFSPAAVTAWGTRHIDPEWRLEPSDRLPERGYVNGFIDLVFSVSGRYFLLDWKSNDLGPDCGAYRPAALARDMRTHRYDLQYHLYLVALNRLLRRRLPDYDYERDFGGVYYLYLRGIQRDDPSTGVFFHRPGRPAVEELEEILCGTDSFERKR